MRREDLYDGHFNEPPLPRATIVAWALALLLALASVDASPAFHQITELVKSGLSLVICARPTNSSPLSPEACSINCLTVCTSGLNSYSPGRQTAPEMMIRLS